MTDSQKFTICIIQPNSLDLNLTLESTPQDLEAKLTSCLELLDTSPQDLLENLVTYLNQSQELMCNTTTIHQTHTHVYQLCYLDLEANGLTEDTREINNIAGVLNPDKKEIRGPCVLILSRIQQDRTCVLDNLNISQVFQLVFSSIIHTGLKIKVNGGLSEFSFKDHPLGGLPEVIVKNYRYFELNILKLSFLVFLQEKPLNPEINKTVTQLVGRKRVLGDCFIIQKLGDSRYGDVDLKLWSYLITATLGPLYTRNLTKEELEQDQDALPLAPEDKNLETGGQLQKVNNGYLILYTRYLNHKLTCLRCDKKLSNKSMTCTGCYRVRYCSKECFQEDWYTHQVDCLFGQAPLNQEKPADLLKLEQEKDKIAFLGDVWRTRESPESPDNPESQD